MTVAFFCMPEPGHFHRLRAVIAGVVAAGHRALVFTDRRFRAPVEAEGGEFVDLFERYAVEDADAESQPVPCRYVSFAGHFAGDVVRDLRAVRPSLVVYDTFAIVGRLAADLLGVPGVNVCAGHNVKPAEFLQQLERDPRVRISDHCHRAVRLLRDEYGMKDASPFSYVSAISPHLNLYCEPPEYLDEEHRAAFSPLAFFGSLRDLAPPPSPRRGTSIYVSFGTVVWRYFAREAMATLRELVAQFARMDDVRVLISLGRTGVDGEALRSGSVRVEDYVDQWRVLREADLFVTHHGLNSTHEAAYCGVPMISFPFFWDQPALAAKCQDLGLAVPLTRDGRLDAEAAMEELRARGDTLRERLALARAWEEDVVAGRGAVVRQMLALA